MSEDPAPYGREGDLRARLRFSPHLRALLVSVVGQVHTAQARGPDEAAALAPTSDPPDPELSAAWAESLREHDKHDTKALLDLVNNPKFGAADLALSISAVEAITRASVRVRLHLRHTLLRDLRTDQIEGNLDFYRIPLAEQQGYACYRLLAHLEHDLLIQLDPGLLQ